MAEKKVAFSKDFDTVDVAHVALSALGGIGAYSLVGRLDAILPKSQLIVSRVGVKILKLAFFDLGFDMTHKSLDPFMKAVKDKRNESKKSKEDTRPDDGIIFEEED